MARSRKIESVMLIAPETIQGERVQAAVDAGKSAQEVADIMGQPAQGEYWEYLGEELGDDGRMHAKLGDRVQWVHPPDKEFGEYRVYEGDDADYVPVVTEA